MKLRLLITETCPRACEGCCNKQWDLAALPVCTDFSGWDEILLTGGEPMIKQDRVHHVLQEANRVNPNAFTVMYTALTTCVVELFGILMKLDGLTITLHEQKDVPNFARFNAVLDREEYITKSLRLNVFVGIDLAGVRTEGWQVKDNIVWIPNCPLPEGEVFMNYCQERKET